jgi:hypothetical protein
MRDNNHQAVRPNARDGTDVGESNRTGFLRQPLTVRNWPAALLSARAPYIMLLITSTRTMITKTPMMVPMMPLFMVPLLPSGVDGRARPSCDQIGSHPSGAEGLQLPTLVRAKISQTAAQARNIATVAAPPLLRAERTVAR